MRPKKIGSASEEHGREPTVGSAAWNTLHLSVPGASHVRQGIPGQDSSASGTLDNGGWAYLVVADGHGSKAYFRSDRGSRFAVESLVAVFTSFPAYLEKLSLEPGSPQAMSHWQNESPAKVLGQWRERVLGDLVADPPLLPGKNATEKALGRYLDDALERNWWAGVGDLVGRIRERSYRRAAEPDRPESWELQAYGTTLLGVLVGPSAMFWLQLGDGALVKIASRRTSYLAPPPPEAFANETPSMCDNEAIQRMQVGAEPLVAGRHPALLLLATDGIPNSYSTQEGFFEFCRDLLGFAEDHESLIRNLERWLPEISKKGSGDDMSVAMAWRSGADDPAEPDDAATSDDPPTSPDAATSGKPATSTNPEIDPPPVECPTEEIDIPVPGGAEADQLDDPAEGVATISDDRRP